MFADYGDLAGNSAEAVSKRGESSAQTNAVTQPTERREADGTQRRDPWGNIQLAGPGESLLVRLVQSLRCARHEHLEITGLCVDPFTAKNNLKACGKIVPCQAVFPQTGVIKGRLRKLLLEFLITFIEEEYFIASVKFSTHSAL